MHGAAGARPDPRTDRRAGAESGTGTGAASPAASAFAGQEPPLAATPDPENGPPARPAGPAGGASDPRGKKFPRDAAPSADLRPWPVPFSLAPVLAERGRRVVVLASGDPFWFGAGAGLARALTPGEWRAFPAPSTFSLIAARLGWPLETVACLGLHAAPLARLRPHLAPGARAIVLLRAGDAVPALAGWLTAEGFGQSLLHVGERLGGPAERVRAFLASDLAMTAPPGATPAWSGRRDAIAAPAGAAPPVPPFCAPVAVGLHCAGPGRVIPCASGRPDDLFAHDGQITKRPVRALALSALAPRPGEWLWDIGAGSGSIAIEWLLSHPSLQAVAVEADPARAARLRTNADRLGADRLVLREGRAPEALADLPVPQAVFVGGGADDPMLDALWDAVPPGTRIVVHAVTLETEALLALRQARLGGSLLRIALSEAAALGRKRGWRAAYPVVQWTVTR